MTKIVSRSKILLAVFDDPTPKPPYRCKSLKNISSRNRAIAHCVPNFVAMATRKSRCKPSLAAFDDPTTKTN